MSQAGFLLIKVLESCSTGADACLRMEKEMGKRFRTGWWFIVSARVIKQCHSEGEVRASGIFHHSFRSLLTWANICAPKYKELALR